MKPICIPCQRFFRPKRNGISFIEAMPKHSGAEPGTIDPENWTPYKLWHADQWECRGCGATIIVGAGMNPIAEHYQPDFAERVNSFAPIVQVNDC